jgi:lysine decarboxylase
LTQRATYKPTGSDHKQARPASLLDALKAHAAAEVASFHTPGHKGIAPFADGKAAWKLDVTELPGLDDLSHPNGILLDLQNRAANIWASAASYISVNGASGALIAALLACAPRGTKVLLPRNAHRSAVNALVLSGLEPVWYEPRWDAEWQTFTSIDTDDFAAALAKHREQLACALVVSPTYSGCISDIAELAVLCHVNEVPLIVDEAHGAHLLPGHGMQAGALSCGADLVVHSAHKTVGALTQIGLLHVGQRSLVPPETVRTCLNMMQTSSPSYLLLVSLEQALAALEQPETLARMLEMREAFARQTKPVKGIQWLKPGPNCFKVDPLHMLARVDGMSGQELYDECCQWGVFPEAVLGEGVLFLLGVGTRSYEMESLADALEHMAVDARANRSSSEERGRPVRTEAGETPALQFGEQVLSPRQAFLSACETIAAKDAVGRIAAECVAPCPPGIPLVVPGMRVTTEAIASFPQTHLRVVVESGPRRT